MITYSHPEHVRPIEGLPHPLLSTPEGGKVVVDARLQDLWRAADGRHLEEIVSCYENEGVSSEEIRAGLACLAEAGLLNRSLPVEQKPPLSGSGGLVSAIVVAYHGRDWLENLLPTLYAQTYTPLEIIVVDNGSRDDLGAWMAEAHPRVSFLPLEPGRSLAAALNAGAAQAAGNYLLLLNQDLVLAPDAVAHMVRTAQEQPDCAPACAAVSPKLKFLWAPAFLNGLGNRVGPASWGTDNAIGHLDLGQFDGWVELPSACFAAALIPRAAWETAGPADEGFQMYYEDSEWSYRARLLGLRVYAAPRAVVYHAFGGRFPSGKVERLTPRKTRQVVYSRFRFAFKLTGSHLPRFLRGYLGEDAVNFTKALARREARTAWAYLSAWAAVLGSLPGIRKLRRSIQARRVLSDDALFAQQQGFPPAHEWQGLPVLTWDLVAGEYRSLIRTGRTHPLPEFQSAPLRPHLLIVSNDVVDVKMGGPGVRYLEMARALSDELEVTLAVPSKTSLEVPGIPIVSYAEDRPDSLRVLVENHDIALISGYMSVKFPFLAETQTRLVVDLYDPFFLENLYYYVHEPLPNQQEHNRHAIRVANRLARWGDFFICGNERQRDFWLGFLAANERINPHTFLQDSSLRKLIDVVGVGIPEREPQAHPVLRGKHPLIPSGARIVLWGGGIWNWLDPLTLVRAWPQVVQRHPDARLVFLGTRNPNPLVPVHEMVHRVEALAEEIGEKDRSIVFVEWLSYADHEAVLGEADIGVTLQPTDVETRFSIRTRVIDYFRLRLPALVTDGDITSEWIQQYGLGRVVPNFDVQAVAGALNEMLGLPKASWASSFDAIREQMAWKRVVAPLLAYCLTGQAAPDQQARGDAIQDYDEPPSTIRNAIRILRRQGVGAFLRRARHHLQWRRGQVSNISEN